MKIDFLNVVNCRHDWRFSAVLSDGLLAVRVVEYRCSKCHITKTETE